MSATAELHSAVDKTAKPAIVLDRVNKWYGTLHQPAGKPSGRQDYCRWHRADG
jgi:hypothetical protein